MIQCNDKKDHLSPCSQWVYRLYLNLPEAQTYISNILPDTYLYVEIGGYLYSIYCNQFLFPLSLHTLFICYPKQWYDCPHNSSISGSFIYFFLNYTYIFYLHFGIFHDKQFFFHLNHFLSVQFSGIKYVHIIVQKSPLSIPITVFILWNWSSMPIKQ